MSNKFHSWKTSEVRVLAEVYPLEGVAGVRRRMNLPVSDKTIHAAAHRYGVKRDERKSVWPGYRIPTQKLSDETIAILRCNKAREERWPGLGPWQIGKLLGVNGNTVKYHIKLGHVW